MKYKLIGIAESFFRNPLLFMGVVFLRIFVKKIPYSQSHSKNTTVWGMVESTKKPIPVTF